MAESTVYAFAKEVFENFWDFQKMNPTYEILTKNDMMRGLTAPIHPGAMKYIKEVIFIHPTKDCPGDIDNNGAVDGADLAGIAADFGNTGCQIP